MVVHLKNINDNDEKYDNIFKYCRKLILGLLSKKGGGGPQYRFENQKLQLSPFTHQIMIKIGELNHFSMLIAHLHTQVLNSLI